MTNAVIIVAAGKGVRAAAAGTKPKQYLPLRGQPVLLRTLRAFLDQLSIDLVQTVIDPDHTAYYNEIASMLDAPGRLLEPAFGGASRQASVLAGLHILEGYQPRNVLIHDAARPFVSSEIINRVFASLERSPACLAAIPVTDTLKAEENGFVRQTISRNGLWRAQTPQAFRFKDILEAHVLAEAEGREDFTDDAALAEWQGHPVELVMGSQRNIKLTTKEDFDLAEKLMDDVSQQYETRIGNGYDVHKFEPGNEVVLCGVSIPHYAKLAGHSDADVGLHALTDALLGAIGSGDIGSHFPPSEPQWNGADSSLFLRHAGALISKAGGRVINIDVTLICERPKIEPHRETMRERIATILDIDISRVSVKATTTEGLGFTGRQEGIAAIASASVELKRKG